MSNTENEQKIKLIWDFKGPESESIAKHHALHLKEYLQEEKLKLNITGFELVNETHTIAYMVVYKDEMPKVRDSLKPHRGQVYQGSENN